MNHPNKAPSPSDIRQEDVRELLPCPFCGQKPFERWEDNINGPKYPGHHFVWCENLDCPAPAEAMEETKYEAHRKWNTRAPLSAQTGEPVAWSYEAAKEIEFRGPVPTHSNWEPRVSFKKPSERAYHRNVQPLYASPPPQPDTAPSPLSTGEVKGTCSVCGERDYPTRQSRCEHPNCPPISQPPATEQIRREVIDWKSLEEEIFQTIKAGWIDGLFAQEIAGNIIVLLETGALAATEKARS